MLFDPVRHEECSSTPWDPAKARETIERITTDTIQHYSPRTFWPSHPLDDDDRTTVFYSLYMGAAGVMWALEYLKELGLAHDVPGFSSVFENLFETNCDFLKRANVDSDGLLIANTGLLLLAARLFSPEHVASRIANAVDANRESPVLELMWGSPGTMLAALFMHQRTSDNSWADKFRRDANWLWDRMELCEPPGCYLWRQDLYGENVVMLGGVHGFAGNVFSILRGWHLLGELQQQKWADRIADTMLATVKQDGGPVNWAPSVGMPRQGRAKILVHHCHGAPGMVNCIAALPDPRINDLLLGAGELIWIAGPLKKGLNLCHGTAGNGFAFLKLFRRTQDEKWLSRARRFAMHAIEQWAKDCQQYKQLRYSLWTGDLGLAIYLWNCIEGTDAFPTMDHF